MLLVALLAVVLRAGGSDNRVTRVHGSIITPASGVTDKGAASSLTAPPSPSREFAPRVAITDVQPEGIAWCGSTFIFRVTALNTGGAGARGSITVSSPDAIALRAQTGSCAMVGSVSAPAPGSRAAYFDNSVGRINGTVDVRYPLAEVNVQSWPAGAACTLVVAATLPASGAVSFLLRAAVLDSDSALSLWPYGSRADISPDQQGFPALRWVVPVERR